MGATVREVWQVRRGHRVDLRAIDPGGTPGLTGGHDAARADRPRHSAQLGELQERLWAEATRSLLVVLQGTDASGKDGAIRHVFEGLNPQAVHATAFKAPAGEELAHDFLWRIHRALPRRGQIGVFNRSHYEDVLAARVRHLVPEAVWKRRYRSIVEFERALVEEGTTVVKLCLLISKAEQQRRFEQRLDTPAKRWKFSAADLADRKLWDDYRRAYEDALEATSSAHAPWYVIPADHKWYRDWAMDVVLVEELQALDPRYPAPPPDPDGVVLT